MLKTFLFLATGTFVVWNLCLPSWCDEEDEYKPEDGTNFSSTMRHSSSQLTLFEGDKALRQGKNAKALVLLKRAVEENDTDFDARVAYATALEKKYRAQEEKDPKLLRECLTHWLFVMRTVSPDEQGASVLKFLYKDDDRDMAAKIHVKKLVGRLPRPFESNDKFIARVCGGETSVQAKIKRPIAESPVAEDASQ